MSAKPLKNNLYECEDDTLYSCYLKAAAPNTTPNTAPNTAPKILFTELINGRRVMIVRILSTSQNARPTKRLIKKKTM